MARNVFRVPNKLMPWDKRLMNPQGIQGRRSTVLGIRGDRERENRPLNQLGEAMAEREAVK